MHSGLIDVEGAARFGTVWVLRTPAVDQLEYYRPAWGCTATRGSDSGMRHNDGRAV